MLIGRSPTARERRWLGECAQIHCIICAHFHDAPDTPAEIHHTRGKTAPGAHLATLSLCKRHHRERDNHDPPRWISRHGDGRDAFERRYAPEPELLKLQREAVDQLRGRMV